MSEVGLLARSWVQMRATVESPGPTATPGSPNIGEAAVGIGQLARGQKSLVFVESRSKAEKVGHALA